MIHEYERQTYYYETDKMGIIHHSNYIRWFEEARIDFMTKMGYPYKRLEDEGIIIPVVSVSSEYKSMVRFGDTVIIKTKSLTMTESDFAVPMRFTTRKREHFEISERASIAF